MSHFVLLGMFLSAGQVFAHSEFNKEEAAYFSSDEAHAESCALIRYSRARSGFINPIEENR